MVFKMKKTDEARSAVPYSTGYDFFIDNQSISHGTSMPFFHYHTNEYEIFYMKKGSKRYIIEDSEYDLTEGDILIVPPGRVHRSVSMDDLPQYRLILYFQKSSFGRFSDIIERYALFSVLEDNFVRIPVRHRLEFEKLFELMSNFSYDASEDELKNAELQCLMFEFLCRLKVLKEECSVRKYNATVESALEYIKKNYRTNLTMKSVSEAMFVSPSYFSHKFRECVGMSFTEYLNELRMGEVIKLLTQTDMSISEISRQCGFASPSYMGEAFKRMTGRSLTEYRRLSVEGDAVKFKESDKYDPPFEGYTKK